MLNQFLFFKYSISLNFLVRNKKSFFATKAPKHKGFTKFKQSTSILCVLVTWWQKKKLTSFILTYAAHMAVLFHFTFTDAPLSVLHFWPRATLSVSWRIAYPGLLYFTLAGFIPHIQFHTTGYNLLPLQGAFKKYFSFINPFALFSNCQIVRLSRTPCASTYSPIRPFALSLHLSLTPSHHLTIRAYLSHPGHFGQLSCWGSIPF